MPQKVTESEFIRAWHESGGSPTKVSKMLGLHIEGVHSRRRRIEDRTGKELPTRADARQTKGKGAGAQALQERRRAYEMRMRLDRIVGTVLVMSDAHYWPGVVTTAHQAFVALCKKLQPVVVVANGDVLDGASISRHERIGWQFQPKLKDELAAMQDRMGEIERAAKGAQLIRTIGNHDVRYERFLANNAAQYEDLPGVTLLDHLPAWRAGWSLWINRHTVVKHRAKGGIHAIYNNTMRTGMNVVTGHLHALNVRRYSDYKGHRWGVDSGTLAEPYGPQFDYTEDDSVDWASGFAVLTFIEGGALVPPEVCTVIGERAWFRGQPVL